MTEKCYAVFADDEGENRGWFASVEEAEAWIVKQAYYIDWNDVQEAEPPADHPNREHVVKYWTGEFWPAEPATLYYEDGTRFQETVEPVRCRAWVALDSHR